MRKAKWSLLMISLTGLLMLGLLARESEEAPVEARVVTVQRGDVHQVIAITGRISYANERYIYAKGNGKVTQLCAKDGQRLAAGEALIRMENAVQEDALSAFVEHSYAITDQDIYDHIEARLSDDTSVVRADEACTLRQLLITEDSLIASGMPVARVSSHQQEIVCEVVPVDAERVYPGMWAWLSVDETSLGIAEVRSVGKLEADPLTGWTFASVVLHPEEHIELPEGTAVDVDIYLAGSDDVLSLPVAAITTRNTVWWVNEGRCTEIPAEIVMCDEMRAWVNLPEGLSVAVGEFKEGQHVLEADE